MEDEGFVHLPTVGLRYNRMLHRGFPLSLIFSLILSHFIDNHKLYCPQTTMEPSSRSISGTTLTSKPSVAFSTPPSNTSGSQLLFGEIDSSDSNCKALILPNSSHSSDPGLRSFQECKIDVRPHTLFQPFFPRILEDGSVSRKAAQFTRAPRSLDTASCMSCNQRASN